MSFSYRTKAELCRIPRENKCCAIAECYGMLLYGNTFNASEIRVITGSRTIGERICEKFKEAFTVDFDIVPGASMSGKQSYIIKDKEKLAIVFKTYGLAQERFLAHTVNLSVLENECCRNSFIRGAFLTGGAITNPSRSYHLELVTDRFHVSKQTYSLLIEMGFAPKETSRSGNYIIYFKKSVDIEDFLTLIGAPIHAMELMSAKIEKDVRNTVNRKVNCDTANVSKIVDAAAIQITAINKIKEKGKFEALPDKLKQTAELRLENPEMSIKELADSLNPPATKSCLNHRLKKLIDLSVFIDETL